MLYDFPVRLSVTVRDSVLALDVGGRPMSSTEVRVDVEHEVDGSRFSDSSVETNHGRVLVEITCDALRRSGSPGSSRADLPMRYSRTCGN